MFEYASWFKMLPDKNIAIYEPNLKLFFETMYERIKIWERRFILKKERPWTDNEILRDFKFTNVYRELDKNSQWQIKNILLDETLTPMNLIWKLMVFRFFNNPETFEKGISEMGWKNGIPDWAEYNEEKFSNLIRDVRKEGKNPYTNAYLINSMATPGKSRDYCYTKLVIPTLHKKIPELFSKIKNAKNPEEIIAFLKTLPSVSNFIAHEFYQDFTYIEKYTDRKIMKFNQNDYTNVGPGASLGIRLIYPIFRVNEQKQAIYRLRDISRNWLTKIGEEKGDPISYIEWDKINNRYFLSDRCNITLHQIEMWLCEFQKYWKMLRGEGKQRSKFIPQTKSL